MSDSNPMEVGPGESKLFRYLGELIPNQILVTNAGTTTDAEYMISDQDLSIGWRYFNSVAPSRTQSILVQFPSSVFRATNRGGDSFIISGDGIYPYDPSTP